MKKLISIFLIACITFSFTSCVNDKGNTGNNSQNNTTNNSGDTTGNNSQNTTPSSPSIPEKTPSAYEQLNRNEKIIFDAFIINFDQFVVPSSVRITKILKGLNSEWNDCGENIPEGTDDSFGLSITLKCNLTTVGGYNSQSYINLRLTDGRTDISNAYKRGHLDELEEGSQRLLVFIDQPEFIYASPAKLNKALSEYCEEMGFN